MNFNILPFDLQCLYRRGKIPKDEMIRLYKEKSKELMQSIAPPKKN